MSGKLARLTLTGNVMTSKQDLIHDWCQQYPSHSVGDMAFGADGALYAHRRGRCQLHLHRLRPRGHSGQPVQRPGRYRLTTPPSAEGGSLRSQDIRTRGRPGEPRWHGDPRQPDTGAGLPDNPGAASSDPNVRRIVAAGLRNPFRMTVRPGIERGMGRRRGLFDWEEINRIPNPTGEVENFGWPCYEGDDATARLRERRSADLQDLYAADHGRRQRAPDPPSTGHIKPFFKIARSGHHIR